MSKNELGQSGPDARRHGGFLKKLTLGAAIALPGISGHGDAPPPPPAAAPQAANQPKGTLMPIGGGLVVKELNDLYDAGQYDAVMRRIGQMEIARFDPHGILEHIVSLAAKKGPSPTGEWPTLEIITAGSGNPPQAARMYQAMFNRIADAKAYNIQVNVMPDADQAGFNQPELAGRMDRAGGVFLSGGDQSNHVKALAHTQTFRRMMERYYITPGFVIAGSSAGAMAMAGAEVRNGDGIQKVMFKGRPASPADAPPVGAALALVPFFIEVHVNKPDHERERNMLAAAVRYDPAVVVGLDECSSLVIEGGKARAYGPGRVLIAGRALYMPESAGNTVTPEQFKALHDCAGYADMPVYCFRDGESFSLATLAPNSRIRMQPGHALAGTPSR